VSQSGNKLVFGISLIAAALTAFYMTRLYILVFFGKPRMEKAKLEGAHESPWVMSLPLVVLAVLALGGGWFGVPVHLGHEAAPVESVSPFAIMGLSVLIATGGAFFAYRKYSGAIQTESVTDVFGIDRIYSVVFANGLNRMASGASKYLEEWVIQRIIRVGAALVDLSGNVIRVVQVGSAQVYLVMIVLAIFGFFIWFFMGAGIYGNF